MPHRHYLYVGPAQIRLAAGSLPTGSSIGSPDQLLAWLAAQVADVAVDGTITATFVITSDGILRLAPRRSEHVACAAGRAVLSAGEITFSADAQVVAITNQSTGYCPQPESWPHVCDALDRIPVTHPGGFTTALIFRLCPACKERNIVKDGWFVCDLCGADLPADWNFPSADSRQPDHQS